MYVLCFVRFSLWYLLSEKALVVSIYLVVKKYALSLSFSLNGPRQPHLLPSLEDAYIISPEWLKNKCLRFTISNPSEPIGVFMHQWMMLPF